MVLVQALPTLAEGLVEFLRSVVDRPWQRFRTACWAVAKPVFVPVALVVFAATYVAVETKEPLLDGIRGELAVLRKELLKPETDVLAGIANAMEQHGYTTERAKLLDNLRNESRFHFARFPVLFEAARLATGIDAAASDVNRVAFRAGLALDEAAEKAIGQLVQALGPCGRHRKVHLIVEGYASSQPFRDMDDGRSDLLNLQVANARGRAVTVEIQDIVRGKELDGHFEIVQRQYKSLDEMRRFRQFDDRPRGAPTGTEDYAQDLLTRAAHIRIVDAGDCAWDA